MSDRLLSLPAFRVPASGILALAGRCLAFLTWLTLLVILTALRLVVVLFLRLLRPFILVGLFLTIIGGVGVTIAFSHGHHWQDAMQSAFVTAFAASVFVLYSCLAVKLDPQHFDNRVPSWWLRY